jgi:hypothetical protein
MADISDSHRLDPFLDQRWQAVSNTDGSFYVRAEDELRLSVFTTVAGLTITLNGVYLTLHGDPVPMQMTISPTGSGARESVSQKVGPAFMLYLYPTLSGGTPAVGTVDVAVEILQSTNTGGPIVKQLMYGTLTARGFIKYVDVANTVTVSGTVSTTPLYTPLINTVANPAAGADWSLAGPATGTWEVLNVTCLLVTSANAGNRTPTLKITAPAGVESYFHGDINWGANLNIYMSWGQGMIFRSDAVGISGTQQQSNGIPPILLKTGWSIGTNTAGIDVADQYSRITVSVRVF